VIAVADRRGAQAGDIRAATGLGDAQGDVFLSRQHRGRDPAFIASDPQLITGGRPMPCTISDAGTPPTAKRFSSSLVIHWCQESMPSEVPP
jgi:hypothetical protein